MLKLEGLTKSYQGNLALKGVDLHVPEGSLMVLLGPTGAGKTTLMRIVAGLEIPDSGRVILNGRDVTGLQPNRRDVAMVFENLALYPNMTAYENIAYPLVRRGLAETEIRRKVHDLVDLMQISHLIDRKPATFSGGERQRVAIGRALAKPAAIYLLDEPLSSLDAMLRVEMRSELKRLLSELGHTFVVATPDYSEALSFGETIGFMDRGTIQQIGGGADLYLRPATESCARFIGNPEINLFPLALLGGPLGTAGAAAAPPPAGADRFGLRPEHVSLSRAAGGGWQVVDTEPLGSRETVEVVRAGVRLIASVAASGQRLVPGDEVGVQFDRSALVYFNQTGSLMM